MFIGVTMDKGWDGDDGAEFAVESFSMRKGFIGNMDGFGLGFGEFEGEPTGQTIYHFLLGPL